MNLDFGAFNWNTAVHNFIPAQIFGNEFKNSLKFVSNTNTLNIFNHDVKTGTTFRRSLTLLHLFGGLVL